MRYPQELIREKSANLPEPIQKLLGSPSIVDAVIEIGKKYHLHLDAVNLLSEEMSLVLFGLERPQDFNPNIRKYLGLSEDVANLITYDINQLIFSKIRKELEELSQAQKAPSSANNASVPQSSPSAPQVFAEKMRGLANVPKQEIAVTPQTGDNKVRDPYREPPI